MSNTAYNWARDLKTLKSSTLKAVLKELASFENGDGYAWCDIPTLVRFTDQNRKTVLAGLAELVKRGIIEDSGKRSGRTKQIPIYRLLGYETDFQKTRREEQEQGPKGPENGTLSTNTTDVAEDASQDVENIGENAGVSASNRSEVKESQKRNGSENGTVPFSDGKGPVFGRKGSQKRDPTSSYRVLPEDAGAQARGARPAASRNTKPDDRPLTADDIRGWWTSTIQLRLIEACCHALRRRNLSNLFRPGLGDLPPRVQQQIRAKAPEIVDQFVTEELRAGIAQRKATEVAMETVATAEAEEFVRLYAMGLATTATATASAA